MNPRSLHFVFLAALTCWVVIFGCDPGLAGGGGITCEVDRSGFSRGLGDFPAEFGDVEVRPRYICSGDPVTVTWELLPQTTFITCGPGTEELGCTTGIQRDQVVEAHLDSTPEHLFNDETGTSPRRPPSGSATINPTVDTRIYFFEFIDNSLEVGGSYPIYVVPRDPPLTLLQQHAWGCTSGVGGQGGWAATIYEREQLVSDSAPIIEVRNSSSFDINLFVFREGYEGGEVRQGVLHVGESSDNFNGPYYGVWTVSPLNPGMFEQPDCTPEPMGSVDDPDGPPSVITPLPEITLEITLACPTPPP